MATFDVSALSQLSEIIGKSRSHVANTLRLLKLPQAILDHLEEGALSPGHARTLVTADNPVELAARIIRDGLSVRQAEALAQASIADSRETRPRAGKAAERDADTRALERRLSDATGLEIRINHGARGGAVHIGYKTLEQLDALCHKLAG